ncbi:MAG: class I SAM-dependent methyltransferase [Candidatus Eisenbacteria sp.]|nr:class I SAM-dependent methyltransferase [Candidatus Eisenbacteria bacterium]
MGPSERSLYELDAYWKAFALSSVMEEKVRVLNEMIPAGTGRILDVGCGNGLITNLLAKRRAIVGLDWSQSGLRHLTGEAVCASSTAVPFRAAVFDLILCSELLEHLRDADLQATVQEILRINPRHLLISVPNDENLHINELACPRCRRVFNASHHKRSFSSQALAALFPGYEQVATRVGGTPVRAYPNRLLRIRQKIGRRWYQIPESITVMCPECGNRNFPRVPYNPVSFFCDGLNRLISRRHPYWLYALLRRP